MSDNAPIRCPNCGSHHIAFEDFEDYYEVWGCEECANSFTWGRSSIETKLKMHWRDIWTNFWRESTRNR